MVNLLGEKLKRKLDKAAEAFDGVLGISAKDLVSGEEFHADT